MTRKIFGTDGARGLANKPPITAEIALRLGISAGHYFSSENGANRVVIGKDTRRSGYMLENALTAGFTSVGMNVFLLGPVPTPAVGLLTGSMRADLGVMISASHNSFEDNGIKFFGPDGFKLSDFDESEIEELFTKNLPLVKSELIGKARRINDGLGRYVEAVKTSLPSGIRLNGLKIVVDCANGASYKAAPEILWELGAEVVAIGNNPNGYNINADCGSMYPQSACKAVVENRADLGICLDGDADRVILIDEKGKVANGDQLMALIATFWHKKGVLRGAGVVSTIMSNLGLEQYLKSLDLKLVRTMVGDRYVVERMRQGNFNFGGEQSGHIIMTDFMTTGDGLAAALQFLVAMVDSGKRSSDLLHLFEPCPQELKNIPIVAGSDPLNSQSVKKAIEDAHKLLENVGRLVIRKSGTEPLIRIMVEHENELTIRQVLNNISYQLEKQIT